jgi:hypothetical protein
MRLAMDATIALPPILPATRMLHKHKRFTGKACATSFKADVTAQQKT